MCQRKWPACGACASAGRFTICREITEDDDRELGIRAWICPVCSWEQLTPAPPEQATTAAPGSLEKLYIMAERFHAGQRIFHPQDSTVPGCTRAVRLAECPQADPLRGIRRRHRKWEVRLRAGPGHSQKPIRVGLFDTVEEACAARDAAEARIKAEMGA